MIDRKEVLRRVGEDQEILMGVVEDFLFLYPDMIANLRRAVEGADDDGAIRAAHVLKSAAATVGADALREMARELEERGRGGDTTMVAPLSQQIFEEIRAVDEELRRWMKELG